MSKDKKKTTRWEIYIPSVTLIFKENKNYYNNWKLNTKELFITINITSRLIQTQDKIFSKLSN